MAERVDHKRKFAEIGKLLCENYIHWYQNLSERISYDASARDLRFAQGPGAVWAGNLRDLAASVQRLCTLAARGRVTLAMVEDEIGVLTPQWQGVAQDGDMTLLAEVMARPEALDEFDRAQLAAVIRACRETPNLSAAGRRLFAASRAEKASQNDADRLRKYLTRFGLDWAAVQSG